VLLIFLICVFSYYMSLRSEFRSRDVRYGFLIETMVGSSLPPVVCRRAHILFTPFVFVCVVLFNTYCVVFLFCISLSCVVMLPVLWIVHL
jgi:hypothetical protein